MGWISVGTPKKNNLNRGTLERIYGVVKYLLSFQLNQACVTWEDYRMSRHTCQQACCLQYAAKWGKRGGG